MTRQITRPLIGITLDAEKPGGYSQFPWYAARENYFLAVAETGGLPFGLPHETGLVEAYLDQIEGLIVTGGAFDIDPALYGDATVHKSVVTKERRTAFEFAVTKAALARDLPILGICGGQQLLHVALGGALIQHIPDEIEGALEHEQPNPRDQPGHTVAVIRDTLLHDIVGTEHLDVNSSHHQAVKDPAGDIVVNAVAPDGVIEGIEHRGYRFCLGVQWHPEFFISKGDRKIFEAFVEASFETPLRGSSG